MNSWFVFTSYRRATTEADAPGSNDAATISRFSASVQVRRRRRASVVSIIAFVDTYHPHQPSIASSSAINITGERRPSAEEYGSGRMTMRPATAIGLALAAA